MAGALAKIVAVRAGYRWDANAEATFFGAGVEEVDGPMAEYQRAREPEREGTRQKVREYAKRENKRNGFIYDVYGRARR